MLPAVLIAHLFIPVWAVYGPCYFEMFLVRMLSFDFLFSNFHPALVDTSLAHEFRLCLGDMMDLSNIKIRHILLIPKKSLFMLCKMFCINKIQSSVGLLDFTRSVVMTSYFIHPTKTKRKNLDCHFRQCLIFWPRSSDDLQWSAASEKGAHFNLSRKSVPVPTQI